MCDFAFICSISGVIRVFITLIFCIFARRVLLRDMSVEAGGGQGRQCVSQQEDSAWG
jgi:hypothetical protein